MPYHGNPFTKGRLFVVFRVKFPATLPQSMINSLKGILPKAPECMLSGEEESCDMTDVDISQFGQGHERMSDSATHEDEDEQGGQRVQCQNM